MGPVGTNRPESARVSTKEPIIDDHQTWTCLQQTSVPELRRRAAIIQHLVYAGDGEPPEGGNPSEPAAVLGDAERFLFNDDGGRYTNWNFFDDGRVLLTVFDHDTGLNLFADEDAELQYRMYHGLPDDMKRVVIDQPPSDEAENLQLSGLGIDIQVAGGVYWFDRTVWQPTTGLREVVAEVKPRGEGGRLLDEFEGPGLGPCLEDYVLDGTFTLDRVCDRLERSGLFQSDLAAWRSAMARALAEYQPPSAR